MLSEEEPNLYLEFASVQCSQIVEPVGPHRTDHELMLSFLIKRHETFDEKRKHELVGCMLGDEKCHNL